MKPMRFLCGTSIADLAILLDWCCYTMCVIMSMSQSIQIISGVGSARYCVCVPVWVKKKKETCLHVLTAKLILILTHLKLGHIGPSGGWRGLVLNCWLLFLLWNKFHFKTCTFCMQSEIKIKLQGRLFLSTYFLPQWCWMVK